MVLSEIAEMVFFIIIEINDAVNKYAFIGLKQ
jgi:hypothetical protein